MPKAPKKNGKRVACIGGGPASLTVARDLAARIEKTIAFINGFKPEQIDGTEEKEITLKMRAGEVKFKGQAYLQNFVHGNFYFHVTTTYAILRHNGVEVGKMDYLGK